MSTLSKAEMKDLQKLGEFQNRREFQRGLKLSTKMAKANPKNSEAIAWKSFFTFMKDPKKNKEEAINIMKDANKADMKNPSTWKISGMLYKETQDYTRTMQCMRMAYKLNSKDLTVLNELCSLDLYEKQFPQLLIDTRAMFELNPSVYNVMRYAMALLYNNNLELANKFLDIYQSKWQPNKNDDEELFRSEFCLFRMIVLMRLNKYKECLEYIETVRPIVRDVVLLQENQVECCIKLGLIDETVEVLHELIKYYPENGDYFQKLEQVVPQYKIIDELLKIKADIKSKYAHVRALEIMDINDVRFRDLLVEHLKPLMIKGAPSTYMTIRMFSEEKKDISLEIVRSLKVPISSVPIQHLFAAHIYGFRGLYDQAIEECDAGLKHTATCIELIAWKARFLAKSGRIKNAIETARDFRQADPADRNASLLFVKMLHKGCLRNIAQAEADIFAGEEMGQSLLLQTQFNVYNRQAGISAIRCGEKEEAYKMFEGILQHFVDYRKGLFNYLGWGSKRARALLEMFEYVERIEQNKLFGCAVKYVLQMNIADGKIDNSVPLALRAMTCGIEEAVAYCIVIFALKNMVLQAVRFLSRINGPAKYIAAPAVKQMFAGLDAETPDMVKEIANEFYKPLTTSPESEQELFYFASGSWCIGDIDGAKSALSKIVTTMPLSYKQALEIYTFAVCISGKDELKTTIGDALKAKYPTFEFDPIPSPEKSDLDALQAILSGTK